MTETLPSGPVPGRSAALHRPPPPLDMGRNTVTVLADSASTGGVYSLYRFDLQPNAGGPRPHYHRTFAESFAVLDGDVELFDGEQWIAATSGDHLFIPAGVAHGFRHTADAPASLIMLSAPGAPREDYFAELAEITTGRRTMTSQDWIEMWARYDQYPA